MNRLGSAPSRRTVALLIWLMTLCSAHAWVRPTWAAAPPTRMVEASFLVEKDPAEGHELTEPTPPSPNLAWKPIGLPFQWKRQHTDRLGIAWLRLNFDVTAPAPAAPAVYVPRLTTGGAFFLNGVSVAVIPGSDEFTQVRWRRPHLIRIPSEVLREGRNTLQIRIVARDSALFVPELQFGAASELQSLFDARYLADFSGAQFSAVAASIVAVFMIAIWWFRRTEWLFLLFGLTCLFWALRTSAYLVETVPWMWWWRWRALYFAWTAGFALSIAAFFLSYIRQFPWRWRLALVTYALIGPIALAASGGALDALVGRYWMAGLFVLELYVLFAFFVWFRRHASLEATGLVAAAVVTFLFGANDYAVNAGWMPYSNAFALHFGAPVVMLAMGGLLTSRFVVALNRIEANNQELVKKVRQKEEELSRQYERARAVERREAIDGERQRIMQDMHDGLGSQLMSSLLLVERGNADKDTIARSLREAIDDMRLAIDALGAADADLQAALANLRYRIEPRIRAAGIELDWCVPHDLPAPVVGAHASLQMLRVVQESISNALKHSGASCITVSELIERGSLVLAVSDNGHGMRSHDRANPGRGLVNMRKRARSIGADLDFVSIGSGTSVTLSYRLLPVAAAASTETSAADGTQ